MDYLTLILTNNCNQNCSYCYQLKNSSKMPFSTAKRALDLLSSVHTQTPVIKFYGGEPFLEYKVMQQVIGYCTDTFQNDYSPKYIVTTNGLLLTEDKLRYCSDNSFDILLSIDGTETAHECGREKGSFVRIQKVLTLLRSIPELVFKTVSVISPQNVNYLCDSVEFLIDQGANELLFSFQLDCEWDLKALWILRNNYEDALKMLHHYRLQGGNVSIDGLDLHSPGSIVFQCNPGQDRVAITPDGFVYGCSMHIPWFRRASKSKTFHHFSSLCFGHINDMNRTSLIEKFDKLSSDRRLGSQYFRYTSKKQCQSCEYLSQCAICPIVAMIHSDDPFLIPDWVCEIKQIIFKARDALEEKP